MKIMKKSLALLLALFALLSLCACGASAKAPAAPAYDSYDEFGVGMGDAKNEVGYDYAAEEPAAELPQSPFSANADPELSSESAQKIIYSADVSVETTDFEKSLKGIEELAKTYGGWIESSSVNGSNYYSVSKGTVRNRSAYYSLRIPYQNFSMVMNELSGLGNIPYSNTYTENVSSQYYDTEARLKACQTQEERLLEMLSLAENVEEVIIIEDRLTELRYQIESLQSMLRGWDKRVSYSTIHISLEEVSVYTPEAKSSFLQRMLISVKRGLRNIAEFFEDALLWLAEALPSLIVFALVVLLGVIVFKKVRRRRREKKASGIVAVPKTEEPAVTGESESKEE